MHPNTILPGTLELLKALMEIPQLKAFNLAGGTGLALQLGHHLSVDIDLFGDATLETDTLINRLKQY